jgi:DNA-binding response OmpR family regulator
MHVKRVLVVDDEPLICEMLGECMRDEGWLAVCAGDGAEALRLGAGADVAVVDAALAGQISGLDLASQLESVGIPVLMMSGEADALEETLGSRRRGVLAKPFRIATLLEALRSLDGPARTARRRLGRRARP